MHQEPSVLRSNLLSVMQLFLKHYECGFARPNERLIEEFVVETIDLEKVHLTRLLWRTANTEGDEDRNARLFPICTVSFPLRQIPPNTKFTVTVMTPSCSPLTFNCKRFAGLLVSEYEVGVRIRFDAAVEELRYITGAIMYNKFWFWEKS